MHVLWLLMNQPVFGECNVVLPKTSTVNIDCRELGRNV